MILISDMVYVSIESRKGGVGKTTTAITLAENLLAEGYQVLMVDLDIVGTTIDSTFISANNGLLHEVELDGMSVNLVRIFKEVYMAGKNVPSFAPEAEHNDKSFTFNVGKCNFIGSNIYDEKNGNMLLEDPRILYDAIHAYWMLEFVKRISISFKTAIGKDAKVAVILDNSPGFSSIENCIHDYLTDLGPELGKVILVSTIDPQDIKSCRQSKALIEERLNDKVDAGAYYRSLIGGNYKQKKGTQAFESVWNSLCASGGKHPVYHSMVHRNPPPFVSILVNKVPTHIYEQLYAKGYLDRETEEVVPFQNHLLYFFSNSILTTKQIVHQQGYAGEGSNYLQSCSVLSIASDNAKYIGFCKRSRQIGLGDFFKEEWAPLAHFSDIINILRERGQLKDLSELNVECVGAGLADQKNRLPYEVDAVKQFVQNNLHEHAQIHALLQDVVDFVTAVLTDIEGKGEVDFHPEHPKLQEIEDFVISFGLAVYRLHIYEKVCELVNELMMYCLENVENLEVVNKDALSSWIENILEGRIIGQDYVAALSGLLDDRQNARELRKTLLTIVRKWGI